MTQKIGILLINIGSPLTFSISGVRSYLRRFLSDPRVISLPFYLRLPLVYGIIAPFRAKNTLKLYKEMDSSSSPLVTISNTFTQKLSTHLGDRFLVKSAMRYDPKGIEKALNDFESHHISTLLCIPMYPQYASASTGSSLEKVFSLIQDKLWIPNIRYLHQFYQHPAFIRTWKDIIENHLEQPEKTIVLFSYHGIPEKQLYPSQQKACSTEEKCPAINAKNQQCYRAQCFATTDLIIETLSFQLKGSHTVFQSRLGRITWTKPYIEDKLKALIAEGVDRIAIVSPAFTVDCIETLVEIGIEYKNLWESLGGKHFQLLPCPNALDSWVNNMACIIHDEIHPNDNNDKITTKL